MIARLGVVKITIRIPSQLNDLLSDLRAFVIQLELNRGKLVDELLVKDTGRQAILPFLKNNNIYIKTD